MSAGRSPRGTLDDRLAAILGEGRATIAAGSGPDEQALRRRIQATAVAERATGGPAGVGQVDRAERQALEQLARLAAVHRARAMLARPPAPPAAAQPESKASVRRAQIRTRPTVSGNMDVRRHADGGTPTLAWSPVPTVTRWEVRFSNRPSPRADYAPTQTLTLPGETTSVPLPLAEQPLRVHLFGHGRDGRVVRRAIVSGLTRETWRGRWERRATAS